MEKFLTTFANESLYNDFLTGPDCPYVNVSYIVGTDEVKYFKASDQDYSKPFTIKILELDPTYDPENPPYAILNAEIKDNSYEIPIKIKINNGDWQEYYDRYFCFDINDGLRLYEGDEVQIIMKSKGLFNLFANNQGNPKVEISGNIMSTIWGDDFEYCNPSINPFSNDQNDTIRISFLFAGAHENLKYAHNLVLPSKNLPSGIFYKCLEFQYGLSSVPDIYADYLPSAACEEMFNHSVIDMMPKIKAKTVNSRATFLGMFDGAALSYTPQTPKSGLQIEKIYSHDHKGNGEGLFERMFKETGIVYAPAWKKDYKFYKYDNEVDLQRIFNDTFGSCNNLKICQWKVHARINENGINVRALEEWRDYYYAMFHECSSLVKAPDFELGDTEYEESVFTYTFRNCYNLHELNFPKIAGPIRFNENENMGGNPDLGQTPVGVMFVAPDSCYLNPESEYYMSTPYSGWDVVSSDVQHQYLTFKVIGDTGTSFAFVDYDLEYSTDGGSTWQTLNGGDSTATLYKGDTIMWRGQLTPQIDGNGYFYATDDFIAYGNPMSLLYSSNFGDQTSLSGKTKAFKSLFMDCVNLKHADHIVLPATTLSTECYASMFAGCTGLYTAPSILPATTLALSCYENMFYGCTSLISAPDLPATTLAQDCYNGMFYNCQSLTAVPELPATTLAEGCYCEMFFGCAGLVEAPELPATTLAEGCYMRMFEDCGSLLFAPELPATTLAEACYMSMFEGCLSLTTAPVLPATTLTTECYLRMFNNCSALNYIKCLANNGLVYTNTEAWTIGVSSTGTFVKDSTANWSNLISYDGIPANWTVENA